MPYLIGMKCRECGESYELAPLNVCEFCFGPLEVQYDYDAITADISREKIESRPPNLWRYRELLPCEGEPQIGLYSGYTPLVRADRLAKDQDVVSQAVLRDLFRDCALDDSLAGGARQ